MKKLEKMDGKLFESLKPNELSNLAAFVGGKEAATENLGNGNVDVLHTDDQGNPVSVTVGTTDEWARDTQCNQNTGNDVEAGAISTGETYQATYEDINYLVYC